MDLEATTIDSCLFQNGGYDDPVPLYIGTDGDGVNDPEEGNVFGAFGNPAAGDKRVILQMKSQLSFGSLDLYLTNIQRP